MDTVSKLMEVENNLRNQNFCCISLLSPTTPNQKFPKRMINIRSPFFHDNSSATKYAKYLKSQYKGTERDFDIYVVEMGRWVDWPDLNTEGVRLKDLMLRKVEECKLKDAEFEQRKKNLIDGVEEPSEGAYNNTLNGGTLGFGEEKTEAETDIETEIEIGGLLLDDKPMDDKLYYVISFLTDDTNGMYGFKISGILDDESKASERVKEVQDWNKYLDVYIGMVGRWLDWEPPLEDCLEQHWGNEKVDRFMTDYEDNQKKIAASQKTSE